MRHTFLLDGIVDYCLKEPLLSQLATSLVENNCYFSRDKGEWMLVETEVLPTIQALERRKFIETYKFNDQTYIALSEAALQKGLCRIWGLDSPKPALRTRPDVALEDRSSYELICTLRETGWRWC